MAQIKITVTIEATLVRDAHDAVDAMDAMLRTRGGRVVNAKLAPIGERRDADGNKQFSLAKYFYVPAKPEATGAFALTDVARDHYAMVNGNHVSFIPVTGPTAGVTRYASEAEATAERGRLLARGCHLVVVDTRDDAHLFAEREAFVAEQDEDDLDECADCGASTAPGTQEPHECAEIAPVSDAEANEQLVAALAALPAYNGWRAHWEYPGFLAFHRKGSPSVSATPDYNARGQIQVEVDDRPLPNVAWPREGRTPEGYMAVMRPVLDSIAPPFVDRGDIFEAVMAAMQDAEEMGGPEGAQYVALMERIAHEAQGRANRYRERMADSEPGKVPDRAFAWRFGGAS